MLKTFATVTVRLMGALAIIVALAFGVREATASSRLNDTTVCPCVHPNHHHCSFCCGGGGFCTTADICLC